MKKTRLPKLPERRGRPPLPMLTLALVAELYARALRLKRAPIRFIAEQQKISPLVARNRVHAARQRGLLVGGKGKGVSGGRLSARALRILDGLEGDD